jgi:hypothetical protein
VGQERQVNADGPDGLWGIREYTAGFLASHAPGTHEQPVWPFAWRLSVSAFYEPELRNENLGAARGRRRDDHGGQRRDVALA